MGWRPGEWTWGGPQQGAYHPPPPQWQLALVLAVAVAVAVMVAAVVAGVCHPCHCH